MLDILQRSDWIEHGDEDEVAEVDGVLASGTYETWGLWGWPVRPGEPTPQYGDLDDNDLFTVAEDEEEMFVLRLEAHEGETLLDVVARMQNAYLLTCRQRRLTPRDYFFDGFDGRCVMVGV